MSIEMENPQTLAELIDAAGNLAAQINLACMAGHMDRVRPDALRIQEFMFRAQLILEEKGTE